MKLNLSKEKRNQLVLVVICTVAAIAGLWVCLISAQKEKINETEKKLQALNEQIDRVDQVVKSAARVEVDLKLASEKLAEIDRTMPAGDSYLWMNNTLKHFNRAEYKVEMPTIGIPVVGEMNMLPGFPYHQAISTVNGSAYYFELGRFIADFENNFPYMRIQNLSLEPGGGVGGDEREKLSFRMEIVTLIKSSTL